MNTEEVAYVKQLLETDLPSGHLTSCIAAALREARILVGRDPITGNIQPDVGRRASWSGALVYLVFCEQIGTCFRWRGAPRSRLGPLSRALVQFGGFSEDESRALRDLRRRLSHDFTLRPFSWEVPAYKLRLDGSEDEPVVRQFGIEAQVRLPAFDHRIESTFVPNVHRALDEGGLECVHPHGEGTSPMGEVIGRFMMAVIPPRP